MPLSDRALEILKETPRERGNSVVFIGGKKGSPAKQFGNVGSPSGNEARSRRFTASAAAFRDWAAERTNYPREVAERRSRTRVGNAVERAYKRTDLFDKRTLLMRDWEKFCMSPPAASKANVVPMRGAVR